MTWYMPGDAVEVVMVHEPAACAARVKRATHDQVVVEYTERVDDDGNALQETLGLEDKRLRPQLPSTVHRSDLALYKVGEPCDVFYEDAWWAGLVTQSGDDAITATRAEHDMLPIPVLLSQNVRPGYEWGGGVWRRRMPKRHVLLRLKLLPPEQIDTLALALANEPQLTKDGSPIAPTPLKSGLSVSGSKQSNTQHAATAPTQAVAPVPPSSAQPLAMQPPPAPASATTAPAAPPATATAHTSLLNQLLQVTGGAAPAPLPAPLPAPPALGAAGGLLSSLLGVIGDTTGQAVPPAAPPTPAPIPGAAPGTMDPQVLIAWLQATAAQSSAARPPTNPNAPLFPPLRPPLGMMPPLAGPMAQRPVYGAGIAPVRPPRPAGFQPAFTGVASRGYYYPPVETPRSDTAAMHPMRALYLKRHLDKLRPFITPGVAAAIELAASRAPSNFKLPEPVTEQPAAIKGDMREYQLAGLAWLVRQYDHGVNAILADEMGLGKTLQTIAFLAYLTYERKVAGPHLVVVPLSVLPNWMAEFKRFAPDLRVVRIHVNDEGERQRLRAEVLSNPSSFDVAVTTYDMVNSVHFGDALKHSIHWHYLVLDEGHRVKNEGTLVSRAMREVHVEHVLMLTGTPLQNNLHELWALLNFMFPDVFPVSAPFDAAFNLAQGKVDERALEAAHHLLRPFMLRRVKDEVECKLPPKVETRIACPLSECQTFWYRRLLLRECDLLHAVEQQAPAPVSSDFPPGPYGTAGHLPYSGSSAALNGGSEGSKSGVGGSAWQKMMNLLMQLRKVCNHPYLFSIDAEPPYDGTATGEDIVEASGKMQILDRLLLKLRARGHRVVLFSQFARMLDILEDYIRLRGWKYKRLDGSTNRIQRMIDMQQFNKPNSDVFLYILCTRAGGLGVNLQTADTCILYDSDWNPQQDLQAMARVHRIGQTKPVHVYRLVTEGTVEERIQQRAESKLYLDKMVNRNSTAAGDELEKLDKREVLKLLKFGADRIFKHDSGRDLSDGEIDGIIDRTALLAQMEEAAAAADAPAAPGDGGAGPNGASTSAAGPGSAPGTGIPSPTPGVINNGVKVEPGPGADPVAVAAAAAALAAAHANGSGGGAGAMGLQSGVQHSAADFTGDDQSLSTFEFAGIDYSLKERAANASLKELAAQFWAGRSRQYRAPPHAVAAAADASNVPLTITPGSRGRGKRQVAGEDYSHCDYCQRCWDGGELICCDFCPVSMHPACAGLSAEDVEATRKWACPHHTCVTCRRTTAAAGGLLFRCEMCDAAYCEDHMPEPDTFEIVGECATFQGLGQIHPKQACFILCSQHCRQLREELRPTLEEMVRRTAKEWAHAAVQRAQEAAEAAAAGVVPGTGKRLRPSQQAIRDLGYNVPARKAAGAARPGGSVVASGGMQVSGSTGAVAAADGWADDDWEQEDEGALPVRRRRGDDDEEHDYIPNKRSRG